MLEHIPFLAGVGVLVILIGGRFLIWPQAMLSLSQDAEGNPIPVTPAAIRRIRSFGLAIFMLGVLFIAFDLLW